MGDDREGIPRTAATPPHGGDDDRVAGRLWDEIRQAAGHGTGALVTTHDMEEAEQCDRLVVMTAGHVAAHGTADQIIGGRTVTEISGGDVQRAFTALDAGTITVQAHGSKLRASATAQVVTKVLSQAGINAAVETVPATLEEAFVAIVTQISG